MAKRKMSKKDKRFITIWLSISFICICGIILYYLFFNGDKSIVLQNKKELKIVDEGSNKRPIAVMIDNNTGYNTQAGLQDSYINYEILVEGGYTRIMALFKDKDVDLIGPVRSARHYFLDYSLESDAIYAHYGWSTYAENDIQTLGVDNINGLTALDAYWRDNNIKAPHNVFTNIDTLYKYASKLKYSKKTSDWKLLDYSTDTINLSDIQIDEGESSAIEANQINLKYSNNQLTSYQYDADNEYYLRSMDGKAHLDKTTQQQLHYKNILIQTVENYSLDSSGRQDLKTAGSGEGYYITNGYALPIVWEKSERTSKTSYKYLNGDSVKINDGNTFIQIIPTTTTPEFKGAI